MCGSDVIVLQLPVLVILAMCLPVSGQDTATTAEADPPIKITSFYPQGVAGLFQPNEPVRFNLKLAGSEQQKSPVPITITVRNFDGHAVHQQIESVTLKNAPDITHKIFIPGQSKFGFYSVRAEVQSEAKDAQPIDQAVSSFCVVQPRKGRNDPFFGVAKPRNKPWMAEALRMIGVGTMPIGAYWHSSEPAPGHYDWSSKDQAVELYRKAGFRLLGFHTAYDPLRGKSRAPEWEKQRVKRRQAAGLDPHDDEHFQAYARFVEQMVSRYKDRIKTWYLTNEIDIPMRTNWEAPMRYYVRRVKTFTQAARKADPHCRVVGIGVAGSDARKTPPYPAARAIWKQVHQYLDGFWPHPYASPRYIRPGRRVRIPETFLRKNLLDALAMIRPAGKSNLGISENGYAIRPDLATESPQARKMAKLAARTTILARSIPELECLCYFTVFKCREGGHTYGMWEIEGSGTYPEHKKLTPDDPKWPRPVVAAYATVTRFLSHTRDPRYLRTHRDVYACAFKKDHGWVIPAWTTLTDPVGFEFQAPSPVEVYDLMGNLQKRAGPGPVQLDLTDAPLFLVGSDRDYETTVTRFEAGTSTLPDPELSCNKTD